MKSAEAQNFNNEVGGQKQRVGCGNVDPGDARSSQVLLTHCSGKGQGQAILPVLQGANKICSNVSPLKQYRKRKKKTTQQECEMEMKVSRTRRAGEVKKKGGRQEGAGWVQQRQINEGNEKTR